MPVHETYEACKKCRDERRELEKLLTEIRQKFPVTQTMHWLDIFKRLWEFRIK